MGEVLLPFIDEQRLIAAIKKFEGQLNEEEKQRNLLGDNQLFLSINGQIFQDIVQNSDQNLTLNQLSHHNDVKIELQSKDVQGQMILNKRESRLN